MKVQNKVFYQIATDRYYKVGDTFNFGEKLNYQGKRVFENKLKDDQGKILQQAIDYLNSKNFFKNKKIISKLIKAVDESDFVIREIAMEKIRKNEFPNYPSRLKCMFLTDSKEECLKALKIFYQKGHGEYFQAVAVRVNGNVFYSKDVAIGREGLSYAEYLDKSKRYWSQNQDSNSKLQEILFEGDAEIVEILESFRYKRV